MNSNINILGVYYVNPCFSGALDKINGSKEQALKAAGEILCVCCAPWRLGAKLRAHWGPALPSRSCCHGTIKFCHHMAKLSSATALQGCAWKTSFHPVLVQRQGSSSMAELGCASPLHPLGTAWHGWLTRVTANPVSVLEQIFGEGPAWPWQTHGNSWDWWTMTYQNRETWEQISPGTHSLYTNTWPGPCSSCEQWCWSSALVKLHFFLYNCARKDGQRVATCGATCFTFFLHCFITWWAPILLHFFFFCLWCFSKVSPCFPSYTHRSLQCHPIKAESWFTLGRHNFIFSITFPATPRWPPHTCPVFIVRASRLEGDAKICGVAHKNVLV